MQIKMQVLSENSRESGGKVYHSVTGMEAGTSPLLQMLDYSLTQDEFAHKGKLHGKVITLQVENIRAIFSGRPQLSGKLVSVS